MPRQEPTLTSCCLAEVLGTFILIFLGCGAVHTAVTTGALVGSWQVAVVWGFAVTLAVYAVGAISGAHINPAITLCLAVWDGFPRRRIIPYWISQLTGAALAALCLYLIFANTIAAYEMEHAITRGDPGSEVTAAMYGEYFPNPTVAIHGAGEKAAHGNMSILAAMFTEILATGLLALMVMALTDRRNRGAPAAMLAPLFIGMTVAVLVAVFGPMTQACLNPARDFGPRIVAYFAGWDEIALGTRGLHATLLAYLVAPLAGAVLGGFVHCRLLRPAHELVAGEETTE